ncbi:MAG: arginine--tRNA ligase, partial [Candidatus Omnitrophica bacterium]|nr:arginine--tRNA ligase [Candidatus Omnitrophota bacterium]
PQVIAQKLADKFLTYCEAAGIASWVDRACAQSGFLNVYLSHTVLVDVVREVLRRKSGYGKRQNRSSAAINLEFVSANPTGPLSVAHGRQAAVGDVLARLLRSQGLRVTKEYYLNDEGRQIEMLGRSLKARYLNELGISEPFPEEGYHGLYVIDHAKKCVRRFGSSLKAAPLRRFMELGMQDQLLEIKSVLKKFGLQFDRWTSQRWLRTSGRIEQALQQLQQKGALYEAEGATWFASTRYGDDKDRVIRKRDGELTYLAPDIAYHLWKFQKGYQKLLNLWGPDHHGYIARVKAAMKALNLPADRLLVRITQLVTLTRHGKPVPMSKRQGEFVTFREVLDEVGVDATRFFYLMRTLDSPLDFDLDLAKSQSQENPVYYVQYAHARICSILSKSRLPLRQRLRPNLNLLCEPEERMLLRWLFQYPITLRLCADAFEPHGLTVFLRKLSESFHVFYTKHRVILDDPQRSAARLVLIRATQGVIANGLSLLGISAPRKM